LYKKSDKLTAHGLQLEEAVLAIGRWGTVDSLIIAAAS